MKEDFAVPPIEYCITMKRIVNLKLVLLLILSLITVTSAFAMDPDCMMHGCHHAEDSNIICHRERYLCSQITQTDPRYDIIILHFLSGKDGEKRANPIPLPR